jgi:hypothetical protein
MIHEVSRADEVAERRCARRVDDAGLEVEEHRAWYVFAARGLVVKHAGAVELRVVVAAVSTVAAPGDSTTHGAEYCPFPLVTVTVGVSAFTTVRT